MDKAEQTMILNIEKNYGKPIDHWIKLLKKKNISKHSDAVNFLKKEHGFGHGFANLVAHKAKGSDAGSSGKDDLIDNQYKGKESLKPIYNTLIKEIKKFGDDVEIAPKKTYVSLRRKKQFAILNPATKSRFEVQLNLKGEKPKGKLEEIKAANAMCTNKYNLNDKTDINKDLIGHLKKAYEMAG